MASFMITKKQEEKTAMNEARRGGQASRVVAILKMIVIIQLRSMKRRSAERRPKRGWMLAADVGRRSTGASQGHHEWKRPCIYQKIENTPLLASASQGAPHHSVFGKGGFAECPVGRMLKLYMDTLVRLDLRACSSFHILTHWILKTNLCSYASSQNSVKKFQLVLTTY